ncbi:MAG: PilZ domain-containing protein [Deferrisomatales bacterium]|nr:PilZ domain-containing protein [Deferrisomatales bacterium]
MLRYEKFGCAGTNPSPRALKSFLEGKLWEARAAQRATLTDARPSRAAAGGEPEERSECGSRARVAEGCGDAVGRGPEDGDARQPGTRRVRRHPAMFGVWVDRTTPALTEDISPRGLCVRTPLLLKPGTRVGVTVEVPDGDVAGFGMVRWARRTEDAADGTSQAVLGLEFLTPPPELERYR